MLIGIITTLIGVLWITFTVKYPQKKSTGLAEDWRGYITGASLIFLGLALCFKSCF